VLRSSFIHRHDWESTGIARFSLGRGDGQSVVAQAKTGTNQRSQDARFGNPLFGGSVCIKNVGTKIAVTIGANDDNSSGATHI
jgi:hypothetical protein